MAEVSLGKNEFVIKTEFCENDRAKQIPERQWNKSTKSWSAPFTLTNVKYLRREFSSDREINAEASTKIDEIEKSSAEVKGDSFPAWYPFKTPPRTHQLPALNKAWPRDEYAFFHEMRTGKTFTTINLACARAMDGRITALLVFCPTPIKVVWDMQIEEHAPIPANVHVLESGASNHKKAQRFIDDKSEQGLKVLVVGIEALSQGNAWKMAQEFAIKHDVMAVVDESSRIKNFKSGRTEKATDIAGLCKYRLILTGTPITQGIEDLYAQFAFLSWKIIGMKSYYAFRARYCKTESITVKGKGGRPQEVKKIIGYNNVGELLDLVEPYCDVVRMKDVVDLPPNIYQQRYVKPTGEQKKAFDELKDLFYTEHEDGEVLEIETILERMTRYQQIAGGSFPFKSEDGYDWKPLKGKNPKMEELKELIDEIDGKIVIWARFRPEIKMIVEHLGKKYGEDSVVEFHGGIDKDERRKALVEFQTEDKVRFFVSNQQTGGMGIKLSEARTEIYYSNSFSHEERVQSEARAHDVDMTDSVLYVDLILDHRVDKMIHDALKRKESVATFVTNELKRG